MTSNWDRAQRLTSVLRSIVADDRSALVTLLAPDVRVWTPERSASTRDELLDSLRRRDDAFSDTTVDVAPLDVGGDHACAEWTVAMTHTGPVDLQDITIEPTGLRIEIHGVAVAEFERDSVCSMRLYWDAHSLLDQVGAPDQAR